MWCWSNICSYKGFNSFGKAFHKVKECLWYFLTVLPEMHLWGQRLILDEKTWFTVSTIIHSKCVLQLSPQQHRCRSVLWSRCLLLESFSDTSVLQNTLGTSHSSQHVCTWNKAQDNCTPKNSKMLHSRLICKEAIKLCLTENVNL